MNATALRAELTDKYSTKRFAMEYGGYLSNHLLHGAVALFEIGASKEQIEAFATHYAAEKLEAVASDHIDPFHVETVEATDASSTVAIPDHERLDALLGQREDFDALLAFYGHEVQLLGADAAIQKHLPTLAAGLCGALLHGLIQLGYAYHIGGDRLIAEGLAYWHFSYLSFEQPAPDSSSDSANKTPTQAFTRAAAMDAIDALQQQEAFVLSEMHQQLEQPAIAELSLGLFQRKLNAISAHPERGSAAAFERIASALNAFDLSEVNSDVALDFALWLYAMIAHNDFVIAHAVTSAWSLQQLEHLLTPLDRNRAWRVWLHVAVSAFVLQQVRDLHTNDICEHAQLELRTLDEWPTIVAQALALENGTDEHVYKVVQVASEHAGWRAAAASDHGMELGVAKRSTSHRRSSFLTADEREFVTRKAASKVVALKFEGI